MSSSIKFSIHIPRSPIRISRAGALAAQEHRGGFMADRRDPRGGSHNEMTGYLLELEDARADALDDFMAVDGE